MDNVETPNIDKTDIDSMDEAVWAAASSNLEVPAGGVTERRRRLGRVLGAPRAENSW